VPRRARLDPVTEQFAGGGISAGESAARVEAKHDVAETLEPIQQIPRHEQMLAGSTLP
jgi:hypothetical protein